MTDARTFSGKLIVLVVLLILGGFLVLFPRSKTSSAAILHQTLSRPMVGGEASNAVPRIPLLTPLSKDLVAPPPFPVGEGLPNGSVTSLSASLSVQWGALMSQRLLDRWRASVKLPDTNWWGNPKRDGMAPPAFMDTSFSIQLTQNDRKKLLLQSDNGLLPQLVQLPTMDLLMGKNEAGGDQKRGADPTQDGSVESTVSASIAHLGPFLSNVLIPLLLHSSYSSSPPTSGGYDKRVRRGSASYKYLYDGYDPNVDYSKSLEDSTRGLYDRLSKHFGVIGNTSNNKDKMMSTGDLLLSRDGFPNTPSEKESLELHRQHVRKYFDNWDRIAVRSVTDGRGDVHVLSIGACVRDWLAPMLRDTFQENTQHHGSTSQSGSDWKRFKHSVPRVKMGELRTWSSLLGVLYKSGCTIRLATGSSGALPTWESIHTTITSTLNIKNGSNNRPQKGASAGRLPFITNSEFAGRCGFLPHLGQSILKEPLYATSSSSGRTDGTPLRFSNILLAEDLFASPTIRQAELYKEPAIVDSGIRGKSSTTPSTSSSTLLKSHTIDEENKMVCGLQAASTAFVAGWKSTFVPDNKILTLFDHTGAHSGGTSTPDKAAITELSKKQPPSSTQHATSQALPIPLGMIATCNLLPTLTLEGGDGTRHRPENIKNVFDSNLYRMQNKAPFDVSPAVRILLPARKEWFFLLWGKMKQGLDGGSKHSAALTILHSIIPVISTCSFGCSRTLGTLNLRGLSKEAFDMLLAKSVGVLALRAPLAGTTAAEAVACGTPVIATRKNVGPDLQGLPLIRIYKRVADLHWAPMEKLLKLSISSPTTTSYYQYRAKLIAEILKPYENKNPKDKKVDFIVSALMILQNFGFNFTLPYWEQPHAPQTASALQQLYKTPSSPHLFPEPTTDSGTTHALLPLRYSTLGYQAHIRSLFGIDGFCRVVNENAPILKHVVPNVFDSMWESDKYGTALYNQYARRGNDQSTPSTFSDSVPTNVTTALRVKLLAPSSRWTDCSV